VANAARDRRWRHISPWIALLCGLIISTLSVSQWHQMRNPPVRAMALTTAVIVAFLLLICYLLRIIYRVSPRGGVLVFIVIAITWVAPILADYARWQLSPSLEDFQPTAISASSPVAVLTMIWDRQSEPRSINAPPAPPAPAAPPVEDIVAPDLTDSI